MKIFMQLIKKEDGSRSETCSGTRAEIAEALANCDQTVLSGCYVLVLVDDARHADWEFSRCPLIEALNFIKQFREEKSDG